MEKEHLLGKTLEELQAVAEENGLPRFAAKQIASWLYEKRIDHIAGMPLAVNICCHVNRHAHRVL